MWQGQKTMFEGEKEMLQGWKKRLGWKKKCFRVEKNVAPCSTRELGISYTNTGMHCLEVAVGPTLNIDAQSAGWQFWRALGPGDTKAFISQMSQ